jgi:phospholipid-binding lipoprotein MlaA
MHCAAMTVLRLLIPLLLMPALAMGQAAPTADAAEFDRFERINRKVYGFNQGVDRYVIRPVAKGYEAITTPEIRTVVGNFFGNVRLPLSALHAMLQGKPAIAGRNLGRFGINSTVGLLGLFDPAGRRFGLNAQQEDLGQTLAVWGVGEGPFLVLPFIGPSTGRDAVGGAVDGFADPVQFYARQESDYRFSILDLINLRTQFFQTERFIDEAYDPYAFVRDAYRQRRIYAIYDGDPPQDLVSELLMPEDDPADLLDEQ